VDKKVIGIVVVIAFVAIGFGIIFSGDNYNNTLTETEKYSVTYDMNGGTGNITDNNSYTIFSEVTVIFTTTPTKAGYIFVGWSKSSTSSYASYDSIGDAFYIYQDTTLYAVWEPTVSYSYTISSSISSGFTYHMASSLTYSNTPASGYKYALVKFTITNNTYSYGYSPNYLNFNVLCSDKIEYSYSSSTYSYNTYVMNAADQWDITLLPGATYSYYVIYEIPQSTSITSVIAESTYGYELIKV